MDTIFALASAQGKAGVSIVRMSGPAAFVIASELTRSTLPRHGRGLRNVFGSDGSEIDRGLILTFQGPASFTGEDVVEFQMHGSPAVVAALLRVLSDRPDCRLAEPGEFTRRALENGQLDLTQVEGLADLIESETEYQRKQALNMFSGQLRDQVDDWRKRLIRALGLLEVTIDFADEEIPEDVSEDVRQMLSLLEHEFETALAGVDVAERVRSGFEVAIIGSPNVGKSTLLNYLAGRDAAITSDIAGTTRDVIEVRMDLEGLPVTFIDTAGIRETTDHIESIGVERTISRALTADLRVVLVEDGESAPIELTPDDLVMRAKADLHGIDGISGKTGHGVPGMVKHIVSVLKERVGHVQSVSRERHRSGLALAIKDVKLAQDVVSIGSQGTDLAAEHVRLVISALDSLIGLVDVEHVLDDVFKSFCLGK